MQVAPLGGADFAAHAREYCGFVECLHELTLAQRLRGLATRLARLYASAAESAEAGVSQQSEGYCVDDDFETVAIARDLIICEFDQFDLYLVPLDPFDVAAATDKNIGTAQLSDDVLDTGPTSSVDYGSSMRVFLTRPM